MFYINISNGLIKDGHRKRMGTAVWEYLWCIDKITKIDDKGKGWVLGGKPINLIDIADGIGTDAVSANLQKLEEEGYIEKQRTPYGIRIFVCKAKKRFGQKADSIRNGENTDSNRKNTDSNKTVTIDNNRIDSSDDKSPREVAEVMYAFREINPVAKNWYNNKTQRKASAQLIEIMGGKEKVVHFVEKILPKINAKKYAPRSTTPYELLNNLGKIKAVIEQDKTKRVGIII